MMTSIFSPCACFFCPRWSFNLFESSIDALSPSWTTYDPPLHLTSLLWPDLGETHRAEIDDMTACKLFSANMEKICFSPFLHVYRLSSSLPKLNIHVYLLRNPLPITFINTCTFKVIGKGGCAKSDEFSGKFPTAFGPPSFSENYVANFYNGYGRIYIQEGTRAR